ncbi:McrC family protein [Ideonella azotifigens]|uniref:McrC family protein n=1 Tax=Ideonella azotifigens TaxID=513160 RepID=A0ABN1K687_9BURK|nr:McrC family protein [Ideonella azotifigens]
MKLDNYVGVICTPCGTTLEVLPKLHELEDSVAGSRALLRKLIQASLNLSAREVGQAAIERFDAPLSEWVMRRFLDELDTVVKRGLRFDYHRLEEELPFVRGQLDLKAQLRQPPGKAHRFHVRHDVYLPDRAENRLLRLALERVRVATQDPDSWRLAQELSMRLIEVPSSRHVPGDFRAWGSDRLMAHYRAVKPWCELILNRLMPLAVLGVHQGLSLLFPMEKLFERHVAAWLRQHVLPEVGIRTPAASEALCLHLDRPMFRLEPDVLLRMGAVRRVLDMKWKRLDAGNREQKYQLSQSDLYQMFAYGHKYLAGAGQMALIYPRSAKFSQPLPPFDFNGGMRLHVLPFDLDRDELVGAERVLAGFSDRWSAVPKVDGAVLCAIETKLS